MKNSIKQLFRTPMRAILLFLLIFATTALLTAATALYQGATERIAVVESEFTTIGTVEQIPVATKYDIFENDCLGKRTNVYEVYDTLISPDSLRFEGAEYLAGPENRNYYLAYLTFGNYLRNGNLNFRGQIILTFTALEDTDGETPVLGEVRSVLLNELDTSQRVTERFEQKRQHLMEYDQIAICQHLIREPKPLQAGKTYIISAMQRYCEVHHQDELVAYPGVYSSESTEDGVPIEGKIPAFHAMESDEDGRYRIRVDAVSGIPDFMSRGLFLEEIDPKEQIPAQWVTFALSQKERSSFFPVLATDDLNLLPTFHSRNAFIISGRKITEEEFESGAKVCLVPQSWALYDEKHYSVGKKLSLPLICTLSGYLPDRTGYGQNGTEQRYSLLDTEGTRFSTFFMGNYEIVGTYSLANSSLQSTGKTELIEDLIIVPKNSITVGDANFAFYAPMNSFTTSFQIKNGKIEEFDRAFRAAVPESDLLRITYDDNGYEDMKATLSDLKRSAILLLLVGVFAACAMIAVVLFFFVRRQKREVAIMRSLGAKKAGCRAAVLTGILLLSMFACILGSMLGFLVLERSTPFDSKQELEITEEDGAVIRYLGYDIAYSGWRQKLNDPNFLEKSVEQSNACYFLVPTAEFFVLFLASIFLVNRYLKIDPIHLLSQKLE